jgi:hypothetical protein
LAQIRDATAFSAVHRSRDGQMVSAETFEMRPERGKPLQLSLAVPAGCQFARRHRQKIIHADHHLAAAAREWLLPGFIWQPAPPNYKTDRFLLARELMREGRLVIPGDQQRLVRQLGEVVAKPSSGGHLTIIQPRRGGVHGDIAAAFVIAVWAARKGRRGYTAVSDMTVSELQARERQLAEVLDSREPEYRDVETGRRVLSNAAWSASPHRPPKPEGWQ